MKILIVTGALNLPEVTEEEIEQIYVASGEADIVVATNAEEAALHWPDAEIAIGTLDQETFRTARNLRWLHAVTAGADMLMFPEMLASEVRLSGDKGLVGPHLADHAFALLLTMTRQMRRAILEAPNPWPSRAPMRRDMVELQGMTMGIVGLGGTGRAVAQRARAFGMRCIAVDSEPVAPDDNVDTLWGPDRFFDLLGESDAVTICCPLTTSTRAMFNDEAFTAIKQGAYIVNVTRGPIVDPDALVRALEAGRLGGAGLDVTPIEPLPADHALWSFSNVIITPHIAGASQFRTGRNLRRFIANIPRYRNGEPLEGEIDKTKGF